MELENSTILRSCEFKLERINNSIDNDEYIYTLIFDDKFHAVLNVKIPDLINKIEFGMTCHL
jgi:disulfide oxidoreductase YuzD